MITIVNGSSRIGSESSRIADYICKRILVLGLETEVEIISLEGNPIPLWSEHQNFDDPRLAYLKFALCALENSSAVIVVAPEWNGSTTPDLKNLFHYCSAKHLGHKPALIVGVSSGSGGAYVVAELKTFSVKNSYLVYIPNYVIVRNSKCELLDDPLDIEGENSSKLSKRLDHSLRVLKAYQKSLSAIRESEGFDIFRYQYGM